MSASIIPVEPIDLIVFGSTGDLAEVLSGHDDRIRVFYLATAPELSADAEADSHDGSTKGLINHLRSRRALEGQRT